MDSTQYHDNSVILLLSEKDAAFCQKLSCDMNLDFGDYTPHVTVLAAKGNATGTLNGALMAVSPQVDDVFIEGVYFRLEPPTGRLWVGLTVRKSPWIINFRQSLCEELNLPVDNEEYFAHITLGCLTGSQLGGIDFGPLAVSMTTRRLGPVRLAIAENGAMGKVAGVVFEYENNQHIRAN